MHAALSGIPSSSQQLKLQEPSLSDTNEGRAPAALTVVKKRGFHQELHAYK